MKKALINKKFGKLTVISESSSNQGRAMWECLCECGQKTIVSTNKLTTNNTKSCGCLKTETIQKNQKLSLPIITKYKPEITTARRLWQSYSYRDINFNLTFDEWFKFSQQNCYYCGVKPSTTYNYFKYKKNSSKNARLNGNFTYNGLDRIDSSKSYFINNIVSCCPTCNRAKSDRSIDLFLQYISNLKINQFKIISNLLKLPNNNYLKTSIKCVFRHYKKKDNNLAINLETFYTYSQYPCYYCGAEKLNYFNVYLKDSKSSQAAKDNASYYYNGIDRIDNIKPHIIDNIVPCCYYCNFAKSKMTLLEFQEWINRIKEFQNKKSPI